MNIIGAELLHAEIPLRSPYNLSFSTIEKVDSVVVKLVLDNGSFGYGEAVPLVGYSHESKESLLRDISWLLPKIITITVDELACSIAQELPDSPFALSAFTVAKEMAAGEIPWPNCLKVPMVAPVSSSANVSSALIKALDWYDRGYRTIKLKVGRNIEHDCVTAKLLIKELPEDVLLRIDANQAYSMSEATRLLSVISEEPRVHILELVEQPFDIPEWKKFAQLVKSFSNIPLMLDESIINKSDIARAAEVGADFVKLKLFKHLGIKELYMLGEYARELGMKVVLGNGVSTDIGNIIEAVAFQKSGFFSGACECNGYEKLVNFSLLNPPKAEKGHLIWEKNNMLLSGSIDEKKYKVIKKEYRKEWK